MTLLLLDIDGTLIRAGDPDHRAAFEAALHDVYGVPATLDGIRLGGRIERQIARDALARHGLTGPVVTERWPALVDHLEAGYRARLTPGGRVDWLLPGLPAVLDRLVAAGVVLGLLTGNARGVAAAKLEAAGLSRWFADGVGGFGDEADDRHELVDHARDAARAVHGRSWSPPEVVVLGDTPLDVEAAHAAGARAVAVATGRWSADELRAAGPDVVLPDLADGGAVVDAVLARPTRST